MTFYLIFWNFGVFWVLQVGPCVRGENRAACQRPPPPRYKYASDPVFATKRCALAGRDLILTLPTQSYSPPARRKENVLRRRQRRMVVLLFALFTLKLERIRKICRLPSPVKSPTLNNIKPEIGALGDNHFYRVLSESAVSAARHSLNRIVSVKQWSTKWDGREWLQHIRLDNTIYFSQTEKTASSI